VTHPFFTIGHSDHGLGNFIALLADAGVQRVVDVRKLPGSRAHPQFDGDRLRAALATHGIDYGHAAALGGLRGASKAVPAEVNGFWTNRSFHNYADYALSAAFRDAIARLVEAGHAQACATMCAEALWWRCHRRIIADYLLARGERVSHILGEGRIEPARMTPGAVPQPDGTIVYPAAA